jgi:hypothetical protein
MLSKQANRGGHCRVIALALVGSLSVALVMICSFYKVIAQSAVSVTGKHFERVLIVVLENQNYASAMKNEYLNALSKEGAAFTNFQGLYHPSYPNYLAMIAGSSFGVHSDTQRLFADDNQHRTIGDLLDWKNYAEDYPSSPTDTEPFLGDHDGKYARKHVPFLSFKKIQMRSFNNVVAVDTRNPRNAFITDVDMFRDDPKVHPLPRYMLYSPNLDDDGHDPVLNLRKGLEKASTWLRNFFTIWFPLDEKVRGTLVVVTFDESEGHNNDNRIYTVILGSMVKPGEVSTNYDHFSVLRTIEDNFGLPQLNSGDEHAQPITGIWK